MKLGRKEAGTACSLPRSKKCHKYTLRRSPTCSSYLPSCCLVLVLFAFVFYHSTKIASFMLLQPRKPALGKVELKLSERVVKPTWVPLLSVNMPVIQSDQFSGRGARAAHVR